MDAFKNDYIRYNGLPIGTKLYARELNIPGLANKPGIVTVCTKMFKRWSMGKFVPESQEFEEWYLKNISGRDGKCIYDKDSDSFIIEKDVYKFYGYAFGCEFLMPKNKTGIYKSIVRISWDNVRLYSVDNDKMEA